MGGEHEKESVDAYDQAGTRERRYPSIIAVTYCLFLFALQTGQGLLGSSRLCLKLFPLSSSPSTSNLFLNTTTWWNFQLYDMEW